MKNWMFLIPISLCVFALIYVQNEKDQLTQSRLLLAILADEEETAGNRLKAAKELQELDPGNIAFYKESEVMFQTYVKCYGHEKKFIWGFAGERCFFEGMKAQGKLVGRLVFRKKPMPLDYYQSKAVYGYSDPRIRYIDKAG